MTVSEFNTQHLFRRFRLRLLRLRLATLILIGIITIGAGISIAWFAGEGTITELFEQLNQFQANPPQLLEAPMNTSNKYLLIPTFILLAFAFIVTKIIPTPRGWARFVIIIILLSLTIRYLFWRVTTINLDDPLNGTISLTLFALEMLVVVSSAIQLFLMLKIKNRSPQADQLQEAVRKKEFRPTVDILIPSYDEPEFILRRTIMGCQAINYEPKTVYLLDDTRRPHIKKLTEELGCEYLTRPTNEHAKAGNLNNALPKTNGELIVVFDADFVPTSNFLERTVGFFQDEKMALVQTPQSFYNADPIAHNLGLEDILTPEEEVFYRQIQPIKDGAGSVVCSGTAFIVRRKALEEAGGFVTESLSEDYFTGIRLSAQGYHLAYLDEKLSAGLAAENIGAHITQRIRWARGTLQAFFIEANPLIIKGLSIKQRLAHLEGLLHWFTSFSRIFFLLMPLAYSFLQVLPLKTTIEEVIYFFLPFYLVQLTVFSWLNCRSRSGILSDVYSLVSAFPLAITVIQVMIRPFSSGFKVTPKGVKGEQKIRFNWILALPLVILFILSAISLWRCLGMAFLHTNHDWRLGWVWSGYNLLMLGIALLILLDIPSQDVYQWFNLRRIVAVKLGRETIWGVTTKLSEVGLEMTLTHQLELPPNLESYEVELELVEEKIKLQGVITVLEKSDDFPRLKIQLENLTTEQHRQLVELLFCRPGQWLSRSSPGEIQSLFLLFRILIRPHFLFRNRQEIKGVKVAQV
ncbi:glycosyltransferase [Dactylococcopsis salina]|uniref:Glycosyl transferase n=1 Tax=Dactylococcopsis salina (strain PCC 8305) TaxID=13035 RepID=K9YXK5_DACS8|nr:cellulose synthase catalytic subunit [Dactylococcopsis salina]AFZ51661.1 glycosyl transferase [Dactylococcopsis salina PCC 8305]